MTMSYKTASIVASLMIVLPSSLVALALVAARVPVLFSVIAALSGVLIATSLVLLGMSIMKTGDVRCPQCGQGCELRVRIPGRAELH